MALEREESQIQVLIESLGGVAHPINNILTDKRTEALYSETHPALKELVKKGVEFFQVKGSVLLENIESKIKDGTLDKKALEELVVVCQLGDSRSRDTKLFLIDLGYPPALTEKDERRLQGRSVINPTPDVGMNFNTLSGKIDDSDNEIVEGKITPDGFSRPISVVMGFVKYLGGVEHEDINDVELAAKWINHYCNKKDIDKLNLRFLLVEAEPHALARDIDNLRQRLGVVPQYEQGKY